MKSGIFILNGFVIVLAHVRCIYPVEEVNGGYSISFKFVDGFYEQFYFKQHKTATFHLARFTNAIEDYWTKD